LPSHQNQGIGGQLTRAGLEACRAAGYGYVILLGHPTYYPRFGFVPTSRYGIHWDRDVPDEAFMVVELLPGALEGVTGIVHYHPEFDAV
jgi:putative acetyltransferase